MPVQPRPQGPYPGRNLRPCRPPLPVARLCRHEHRRHHAGRRPHARRLLCPFHLEGRSVRRGGSRRRRRADAPARAGCPGPAGARRLPRQGKSRGQCALLHAGGTARRRRPGVPARPTRLRQCPARPDRRVGPRPAPANSTPTRRRSPSWRSAPLCWPAPRATRGSATGCCAARDGRQSPFSSRQLREPGHDRSHAGKPLALVDPNALHDHAVVGPEA